MPAEVQILERRQLLSVNAVNDTFAVANNGAAPTPVQLNVLQNDTTNPVGQSVSIVSAAGAMHGTLQIVHAPNVPDVILYTPNLGYSGTDSFTYTASTVDNTSAATVSLTIASVNHAPTFNQPNYNFNLTSVSSPMMWTVSATDVDPGQTAMLVYSIDNSSSPQAALFNMMPGGQLNYLGTGWPAGATSVSFAIQVRDPSNAVGTAMVTVNAPINHAPTFNQPNYNFNLTSVSSPMMWTVSATDVNPGQTAMLVYSIDNSSSPQAALFNMMPGGQLNYLGTGWPAGATSVSFAIQVRDPLNAVGTAMVTVNAPINHAPTFNQPNYNFNLTSVSGPMMWTVSATDVDPGQTAMLVYSIDNSSSPQAALFNMMPGGQLNYLGTGWPAGATSVSFAIQVRDPSNAVGTAMVTVTKQNLPPVITAYQTAFTVPHDQTLQIAAPFVSGTDPNGDPLTLELVTNVTQGTLVLNLNGTFSYAPNPHFVGSDSFQVRYVDSSNAASSVVTVSLTSTNVTPTFSGNVSPQDLPENTPVGTPVLSVLASDLDDPQLTYSITSGNGQGYFTIDNSGNIRVAASLDYEAMSQHQFSLTVRASDSLGAFAERTVVINVTDVNEPPRLDDFAVTTEDGMLYVFTGKVADEVPGACIVRFGGLLDGHQIACNLDGTFRYVVTLTQHNAIVVGNAVDALGEVSANELLYV